VQQRTLPSSKLLICMSTFRIAVSVAGRLHLLQKHTFLIVMFTSPTLWPLLPVFGRIIG
jgi:hypothetical protein